MPRTHTFVTVLVRAPLQVALQPSPGLAEAAAHIQRPGQHLLKHAVTAAVRERAAAQLGGTGEASAAAVCALRQVCRAVPPLRPCFRTPRAWDGRSGGCTVGGWRGRVACRQGGGGRYPRLVPPAEHSPYLSHFPAASHLQPKLRQVFESVFDCSTASGNNQVRPAGGWGAAPLRPAARPAWPACQGA